MSGEIGWTEAIGFIAVAVGTYFIATGWRSAGLKSAIPASSAAPAAADGFRLRRLHLKDGVMPGPLYVGRILVNADRVKDARILEITIYGFNGTGLSVSLQKANGSVLVRRIEGNSSTKLGEMPPPLVTARETTALDGFEFQIILEQRLTDAAAEAIIAISSGSKVELDFCDLEVLFLGGGDPLKLELWDGIVLSRSDGLHVGVARIMRAHAGQYRIIPPGASEVPV